MQYQKSAIRERIVKAAAAEFAEFGFAAASVRNIADDAGASMGNLYRYFENKDTLFRAVAEPFVQRVENYIEVEFDFDGGFLQQFATVFLEFLDRNKSSAAIIERSTAEQSAEFFARVAGALAKKAARHVGIRGEATAQTLRDEGFFATLAACFCYGVREILRAERETQARSEQIRRLTVFLFEDLEKRSI